MNEYTTQKVNIIFLGEQGVGKSSILSRFSHDTFRDSQDPTVGMDFVQKNIYNGDQNIKLVLWDTAGQEKFRSLIPNYIRQAQMAILVYDITQEDSFKQMTYWLDQINKLKGQDLLVAIVANKSDLQEERKVQENDGQQLADSHKLIFREVSAKSGVNVQEVFADLINGFFKTSLVVVNNASNGSGQQGKTDGLLRKEDGQGEKGKGKKKCC